MKVIDILNAKEALIKLNKIKFSDFTIVYNIYTLTKQFNGIVDMVQQEQQKIVDIYTKKDEKGKPLVVNNQYQFENNLKMEAFVEEINKIKMTDINDISKINIPVNSVQHIDDFSAEDMLALDNIVNWV